MLHIANKDNCLINKQIKFSEVMVIGPNGEKMGLKGINDALTVANYAGLDLVLMNEKPVPVCKIMDYNKYCYEKQRKVREQRKKQKESNLEMKEYRLSVTIEQNDFNTKLRNAKKYLEKGHKIKVNIRLKGRQMAHPELGKEVMLKFADELKDVSTVDMMPKMDGRNMNMFLTPNK